MSCDEERRFSGVDAWVACMRRADFAGAWAVSDLRRRCPYLFRPTVSEARSGGAMSARPRTNGRRNADDAAERAAATGDRRDLLRYLRMRRVRMA